MTEMARDYATLIQQRQPEGPYTLAGFSLGGLLALATAHELEARGAQIKLVGLIDTPLALLDPAYSSKRYLRKQLVEMCDYFHDELAALQAMEPGQLAAAADRLAARMHAAPLQDHVKIGLDWLIAEKLIRSDDPTSVYEQFIQVASLHWDAARRFSIKPIAGPVRHWKAGYSRDQEEGTEPPPDGRLITSGDFAEEILDGRHFALMHPPLVETVAAGLTSAVNGVHAGHASAAPMFAAK